jgi:hypothetical protein
MTSTMANTKSHGDQTDARDLALWTPPVSSA